MTSRTPYARARDSAAESMRTLDSLSSPLAHMAAWTLTGTAMIATVVALAARGTETAPRAAIVAVGALTVLALMTWGMSVTQARHEAILAELEETNARALEAGAKAYAKEVERGTPQ